VCEFFFYVQQRSRPLRITTENVSSCPAMCREAMFPSVGDNGGQAYEDRQAHRHMAQERSIFFFFFDPPARRQMSRAENSGKR